MRDDPPDAIKAPPHSVEAEMTVIGGMFLADDWPDRIGELVSERDFYLASHRMIFRHASALAAAGKPVDVVTMEASLSAGEREQVGAEYLGELVANTLGAANLEHHARIVRDRALLREVLALGNSFADVVYDRTRSATEVIEEVQRKTQALGDRENADREIVRLGDVLPKVIGEIEDLYNAENPDGTEHRFVTGIPELDAHFPGDARKRVIVCGARPSVGKSSLAMQSAVENAKIGKVVIVFSLEMAAGELARKALSYAGSVHAEALATGRLDAGEWERVSNGLAKLHNLPIYIDDSPRLTVDRIRTRARRLKRKVGLDLVIVDYLQLLDGHGDGRYEQVSEISRQLKIVSNELDVAVLALSQVNRKCEDRTDKRPLLSDLRDSGSVEQDADIVLFIYRDDVYNPDNEDSKGRAEIAVAKNRSGRTGRVYCTFVGQHSRFAPTSWRPAPPARAASRRGMED